MWEKSLPPGEDPGVAGEAGRMRGRAIIRSEARAEGAPFSGALGRYQGTARKKAAALPEALRGALGVTANPALPAERRDKSVTWAGDFKALGAILRAGRGRRQATSLAQQFSN